MWQAVSGFFPERDYRPDIRLAISRKMLLPIQKPEEILFFAYNDFSRHERGRAGDNRYRTVLTNQMYLRCFNRGGIGRRGIGIEFFGWSPPVVNKDKRKRKPYLLARHGIFRFLSQALIFVSKPRL